jgi:hypothetical protein
LNQTFALKKDFTNVYLQGEELYRVLLDEHFRGNMITYQAKVLALSNSTNTYEAVEESQEIVTFSPPVELIKKLDLP